MMPQGIRQVFINTGISVGIFLKTFEGVLFQALFQGTKISEKKQNLRQRDDSSTPQWDEAFRRAFQHCIKEKQHLENMVKEMQQIYEAKIDSVLPKFIVWWFDIEHINNC